MYMYQHESSPSSLLSLQVVLTLVTDSRRSLSLKLSKTRVYAPQTRARLGTTARIVAF